MASFDQQFANAYAKQEPVYFKETKIERINKFPVKNGDILVCSIEESIKKIGYLQGFCIDITGHAEIDGKIFKQGKGVRLHFWAEPYHKEVRIKIFTKIDTVIIYNVCEIDTPFITSDEYGKTIKKYSKCLDSKHNGAAMIVEEIENGRRYRCSDTSSIEKPFPFNDIIFTVQKLSC